MPGRQVNIPAIWASTGSTTIPGSPTKGTTYRNATLDVSKIQAAWPFDTVVDSAYFNQWLFVLSTVLTDMDLHGVATWSDKIDYVAASGALVTGTDGKIYKALQNSGPASAAKNPVSESAYWAVFGESTPYVRQSETVTQATHGFAKYDAVRHNGTIFVKAQANSEANGSAVGVVAVVNSASEFVVVYSGIISWNVPPTADYTKGANIWLSPTVAGAITATEPTWATGDAKQKIGFSTPAGLIVNPGRAEAVPAVLDFSSSFGTAGYQKLPSGMIIQWGQATAEGVNTFPVTFPTACHGVWCQIERSQTTAVSDMICQAHTVTTSQFSLIVIGITNPPVWWMAIGH